MDSKFFATQIDIIRLEPKLIKACFCGLTIYDYQAEGLKEAILKYCDVDKHNELIDTMNEWVNIVTPPRIKPTKAKPSFYSYVFHFLKEIAIEYGYNLVLHGSMARDLDLIAIPWTDDPKPEIDMIMAFDMYLRGIRYNENCAESGYMFKVLPGGRRSYVINLNRGGKFNKYVDEEWYIDISITPFLNNNYEK